MYCVISYLQGSPNVVEDADVIYLCYFFVNFVLMNTLVPLNFSPVKPCDIYVICELPMLSYHDANKKVQI